MLPDPAQKCTSFLKYTVESQFAMGEGPSSQSRKTPFQMEKNHEQGLNGEIPRYKKPGALIAHPYFFHYIISKDETARRAHVLSSGQQPSY